MTAPFPIATDTRIAAADHRQRGQRFVAGDQRTSGWTTTGAICCPVGHVVRDAWLTIGETTRRCGFRERGQACDILTWELWVPHAGLVFVAEIDKRDLDAIRDMTMPETLAYLGAPMWPTMPRRRKLA